MSITDADIYFQGYGHHKATVMSWNQGFFHELLIITTP